MKIDKGGYTIVEVLIVLAVSSLIFLSAVLAVQGRSARTGFDTGMREIDSKLQDWLNDTTTGYYPGAGQNGCQSKPPSNRPSVDPKYSKPSDPNYVPECVFLGKAIHAPADSRKIFAYTVLGNRLFTSSTGSVSLVNSMLEAKPEPIAEPVNLTDTYELPEGITVKRIVDPSGSKYMAGYYIKFDGGSSGGTNSTAVDTYLYNADGFGTMENGKDDSVVKCIEDTGLPSGGKCIGDDAPVPANTKWTICFDSNSGRTAQISILNNGVSLTTKLDYDNAC